METFDNYSQMCPAAIGFEKQFLWGRDISQRMQNFTVLFCLDKFCTLWLISGPTKTDFKTDCVDSVVTRRFFWVLTLYLMPKKWSGLGGFWSFCYLTIGVILKATGNQMANQYKCKIFTVWSTNWSINSWVKLIVNVCNQEWNLYEVINFYVFTSCVEQKISSVSVT